MSKNQREKRTVNLFLLVVTLLTVSVAGGCAFFIRRARMPQIAKQFLHLADVEVEKAEQAEVASEKSFSYRRAADFVYRYVQIAGRNSKEEVRMVSLWDSYVEQLPERSRVRQAAVRRQVTLYRQALGSLEIDGATDEANAMRLGLLDVLEEQDDFIAQKQQAERLIAHDLLESNENASKTAVAKAVAKRLETMSLASVEKASVSNPHLPAALGHLAKSIWRLLLQDSLPLNEEATVCRVLKVASEVNPEDDVLAMQYALLLRDHASLLSNDLRERFPSEAEQHKHADAVMDRMVKANRTARTLAARAQYKSRYELKGAHEDIEAAIELADEDDSILLYAARTFYREGIREDGDARSLLLGKASGLYGKIRERNPEVREGYWGAVDVLLQMDEEDLDLDEAAAICKAGLERFGDSRELLTRLARIHISKKELDDVARVLDKIDQKETAAWQAPLESHRSLDISLELVRALLEIEQKKFADAVDRLSPIAAETTVSDYRLEARKMLGFAYQSLGVWDRAGEAFESAITDAPSNLQLRLSAAANRLRASQYERAASHYDAAVAARPSAALLESVAEVQLTIQSFASETAISWIRFNKAVAELRTYKNEEVPWTADALEIRKAIVLGNQDLAARLLVEAEESHGDAPRFRDIAASLWLAIGNVEKSEEILAAKAQVPTTDAWSERELAVRTRLLIKKGDYKSAASLLTKALKHVPPGRRNAVRLALIETHFANQDVDSAIQQFVFDEVNPSELPDIVRVLDSMYAGGRFELASVWESRIARIETGSGEGGDSADEESLDDVFSRSTFATFLKARRLLSIRYKTPRALKNAIAEVKKILPRLTDRPDWHGLHLVRAQMAELEGKSTEAQQHLELAVVYGDQRLWVIERLVLLYYQNKEFDKALTLLNRLSRSQYQSQHLNTVKILLTPTIDAENVARKGLEARPNDPSAHLWLGVVLQAVGKNDEALPLLQKVVKMAPKHLRGWNALFTFYLSINDKENAETTLEKMAESIGGTRSEQLLILAQGYEHVRPERARAAYEECLTKRTPEDKKNVVLIAGCAAHFVRIGELTRARDLFGELLALAKERGDEPLVASVHRALAAIEASDGSDDWLVKVQDHLEQAGDGSTASSELNSQIEAILCIQRGEIDEGCHAQEILETLKTSRRINVANQFLLAQLYVLQSANETDEERIRRKQDDARRLLVDVCRTSQNLSHHLRLIGLLLRMKAYPEADKYLARLEDSNGTMRVALERCRWLHLQDLPAMDMVAVVKTAFDSGLKKSLGKQKDKWILNTQAGQILESVGLYKEATPYFETAYELDPAKFKSLATNYANCNQVDKAIALCKTHASNSRPNFVIFLTAVLASGNATQKQLESLRPDVEAALMEVPESNRLRVAAGLYYMAMREMDAAKSHYETVLSKDSRGDIIALNNLALILSEDDARLDDASGHIDTAMDQYGNLPALLDTRAMIHLRKDQVDDAISKLNLALSLELFPDPVHHFHLAAALLKAGKVEKARENHALAKKMGLMHRLWTESERQLAKQLDARFEQKEAQE